MPQVEFEGDSAPVQRPSPSSSAREPLGRADVGPRPKGMAGLLMRCGLASTGREASIELVIVAIIAAIIALWPVVKSLSTASSPKSFPPLETLYTRYGPPPLHP